jgi:integrase
MTVSLTPPESIRDAYEAKSIAEFVALGQAAFRSLFPLAEMEFDSSVWDVRGLQRSATKTSNARLYFTRYRSTTEPLPAPFAEVVKSLLLLHGNTTNGLRLDAFRVLWDAIAIRDGFDPAAFRWKSLTAADIHATERRMLEVWSPGTTNKRCNQLVADVRLLASRGIAPEIYARIATPRQEDISRHTIAGNERALAKRPSPSALRGVADIYARHAVEPSDRLLACALAILAVAGLRVSEALELTSEPIVSDTLNGKSRVGLRINKKKSQRGAESDHVLWLTPLQASVVLPAIEEARSITEPARERARVLEADPDRVPLPDGIHWNDGLTGRDVAALLGMKNTQTVSAIPRDRLIRTEVFEGGRKRLVYRASDVASYLQSIRVRSPWMVNRADGRRQLLSESRFITLRNFFHPGRGTNPLLVEPVTQGHIAEFLGSTHGGASAFERFGIRKSDGTIVRMHSHQFRHWITDTVAKGGATDAEIARWQGREHFGDIAAYKHMTSTQRVEWAKRKVRDGEARGPIADLYFSLVEDVRDSFLDGQLQAVHVTPLGLCVHDFTIRPCPFKLACLARDGCSEYLFDTSCRHQRESLVQLVRNTKVALTKSRERVRASGQDLSETWAREQEETIRNADRILGTEPNSNDPVVRPFADQPSRFRPVKGE